MKTPQDITCTEKETVCFEAELNKENIKVQWLKNGGPLPDNVGYEVKSVGNKHYLIVNLTNVDHDATYTIKAADKTAEAKLTVDGMYM